MATTLDYSKYLTDEQKTAIITQRLQQFAAEHFQNQMNKESVLLNGANPDKIANIDANLQELEIAIGVHEAELKNI